MAAAYRWVQVRGPAVVLSNPLAAQTTFVAPDFGDSRSRQYAFQLLVDDADSGNRRSVPAPVVLDVVPPLSKPSLAFVTTALAAATAGRPYTESIQVSGGVAPYRFALASGLLPADLQLSASLGTLSGLPLQASTTTVQLSVTDSAIPAPSSITATFTLLVRPAPLALLTAELPNATVGVSYSQPLVVSGGAPPYLFAVSGGSLPFGLSLDGTRGLLSGTALAATTATFDVTVADSSVPTRQTARVTFRLTARPLPVPPLVLVTSQLADAVVNLSYSQTLVASGGVPPYLFTVPAGSLPFGLSLDGLRGVLSGTPTQIVTANLTLAVVDSASQGAHRAERAFRLTVVPLTLPLAITSSSLPAGVLAQPYSADIAITGGVPPYSFSVSSGQLPVGLALDGKLGIVSGTPLEVTRSDLSITARDSTPGTARVATRPFTLSVGLPALILLTTELPDGLVGSSYIKVLSASGGTPPYRYSLAQGELPAGLFFDALGRLLGLGSVATRSSVTILVRDSASVDPQEVRRTFELRMLEPFELTVPPRGGLVAFSLGPAVTPALKDVQQLAEAAGASQVVYSDPGPQGRGQFFSFVKGLGQAPAPLRGGRGYLVRRPDLPAARLALRGLPWPGSDFVLNLPAGISVVAVPRSVVETRTTEELLAVTGSGFLVTTELNASSKLPAFRVFLPGMPRVRLDAGSGYLLSLPSPRRIDLLRFLGTAP